MITANQKKFLQGNERLATPFQVIDLSVVSEKYSEFKTHLPFAQVYYAVKSNPEPAVIKKLIERGSCFDTASIEEIDLVLSLGAAPSQLSYGSTIKKSSAIKEAFEKGIDLFAVDNPMEMDKIATNAPGAGVYCRILHDGTGSGYPLNHKFGTTPEDALSLLLLARDKGLKPRGISFHVGSQAKKSAAWVLTLEKIKTIFDAAEQQGLNLDLINLGGGFPTKYRNSDDVENLEKMGKDIGAALHKYFPNKKLHVLIEPGRGLISEAAISVTEVISRGHKKDSGEWLYIDLGVYNGLFEAIDPTIQHNILPLAPHGQETMPMILAGPTCDSWDTLYGKQTYNLPKDLHEGDRLMLLNTGSYSGSMSSLNFNGFKPIAVYTI